MMHSNTSMKRFTKWSTSPEDAPHHMSANNAHIYKALDSDTNVWSTPSEDAPHPASAKVAY